MKSVETVSSKQAIRQNIQGSRPYLIWLIIWGFQSVTASTLEFIGQWVNVDPWQPLPLWIALAASAVVLWRKIRLGALPRFTISGGLSAVSIIIIIGAIWTHWYVQAANPFFIALLKSFIIAASLAQLGAWLGRPILYIGIWQFVLTVVVAIQYLGLASVVLGGAGGLSMLGLGWLLYIGSKQSEGAI
ncbi:hypothetical protein SAMN03159341_114121 [Paenibacillus sp. 1_12]|uniref:hypothetical protein n=1 Tax=Paenibacillus sp. 1_12 TaxID=1566278 RepID=UPI0008E20B70|nr:hypothetical protein [Paenibacillus sp. 1_12]SFM03460.1 hypothetical protein SAMN03159341_114121 [Paenibacillus sp. 1_12]